MSDRRGAVVEQMSRRGVLKAGGALGALGVVGAVSGVTPAWAWSSRQSIVGGSLATVPPENVWDPESDAVVHRLFREEGISRIEQLNALLRPWHRNDQALPAGLPTDLVAFIEQARTAPAWLDRSKLAAGFDFYKSRGLYTGLLYGLGSGIMSCAIPDEARAVYHSKGGEDMQDRVSKTAKLGYDIGTRNAFAPDGEMIVTCIKTRLTHSAVRYLITSSPRWQAGGTMPAPISQRDLIITWHSLATFINRTLDNWRVRSTTAQKDGYLHTWQVTAYYLGIEEVYIPATWADAQHQSDLTLDPILAATPEGIALTDILLDLVEQYDGGLTRPILDAMARYMVGTTKSGRSIGDMLEIPRNSFWDGGIKAGWPAFIAFRESGIWVPGVDALFWAFDEIIRMGLLWAMNEAPPAQIFIEMPTANRSESSYGY
jgi:endo-cleaving rubber dioxygenase